MPNNRFLLALIVGLVPALWVLAQAPGPAQAPEPVPDAPPTPAEQKLDESIVKLRSLRSIQTDIRQQVEMLGQRFTIEGQYLRAPGNRIRLELNLEDLPGSEGTMLQVSDGRILWDYSKILDSDYYFRVDLDQVLERLASPEFDEMVKAYFINERLGLAGPDAMLNGLRQVARFEAMDEGELDGKPVWIIRGEWNDLSVVGVPPGSAGGPMALLPAYIPRLITVWVGQEDGWPYQILLQGKKRPKIATPRKVQLGPDGRPSGRIFDVPDESPSMFLLTYSNVELDPEIDPNLFAFRVPDEALPRVINTTDDRLAELELASAQIQAAQRGQAAEGAGSLLLDGALEIPPIAPDTGAPPTFPEP